MALEHAAHPYCRHHPVDKLFRLQKDLNEKPAFGMGTTMQGLTSWDARVYFMLNENGWPNVAGNRWIHFERLAPGAEHVLKCVWLLIQ